MLETMRVLDAESQLCESPFGLIPNFIRMQMYATYFNKTDTMQLKTALPFLPHL